MKKASILLIALVLTTMFAAYKSPASLEPKISVNTELLSFIGQPFKYFAENFNCESMEYIDEPSYGPPVARYTLGGIIYTFNNLAGYAALTEDTPCTGIRANYTELLTGIKPGELTKEILCGLFGEYTEIHGYENQYHQYSSGYAYINFSIDENDNYRDFVDIGLNWGFRFNSSTLFTACENTEEDIRLNAELVSLIGQPFSYFNENFGWELSDLKLSASFGPTADEYTIDGITYIFAKDTLTDDILCTGIRAKYTALLLGIKQGVLTEGILRELLGNHYLVCGREDQYHLDSAYLYFKIDEAGNYEDTARLSIDWEFRQR